MDTTLIGAMSAVLGSLVGGSATVATAWLTQKTANKREHGATEYRKREALYGEFIAECSKLLIDAMTHTLDKPETLLPRLRPAQPHPAVRLTRGSQGGRASAEANHRAVLLQQPDR